jgi:ribosomal protein S8
VRTCINASRKLVECIWPHSKYADSISDIIKEAQWISCVQKTHGAMPEQPADILLKGTLSSQIYLKIIETNLQHKRYFSIHNCECANDSPCKEYTFN